MAPVPTAPRIFCFGEILWDCLPHGRFLGGAPFNVAYHAARLGAEAVMVSAVGEDALGAETLARIAARGLATAFITRDPEWPTGTVNVRLDARGNASYCFTDPAAWDRIPVTDEVMAAARGGAVIVFGSLALRHEFNRAALGRLLDLRGPLKVFDVNLRPPYDDVPLVLELARRADALKLNDAELARLTGASPAATGEEPGVRAAIEQLAGLTGCGDICVTRGERGALWWRRRVVHAAAAPPVRVRDTIGAGDAFTAALALGLARGEANTDPARCLRHCCALGAFVASQDGAQPDYEPRSVLGE
jgi:fructokinase